MEKNFLTISHVDISIDSLLSALHVDAEEESAEDIRAMHRAAMEIARPVALYAPFPPEVRGGAVVLNGVTLKEPFVHKMISNCNLVVPYVASCGREIEAWSRSFTDIFNQFVADTLKQMCLGVIREKLFGEVKEKYFDPEKSVSTINPGSLKEWPITGQRPLFQILGGVTDDIGVALTDSLLMMPTKSVSGIIFQTERAYHNCQLCPRTDCPGRRVPYAGD